MTKSLIIKNKVPLSSQKLDGRSGFTLVEMAIVIMIGGILLAFMGSALTAYMKKSRITTTEFRMEKIQEAMEQYLSVNQHYPCVANRRLGADDAQFGRRVGSCGTAATGTVVNGSVHIGAVPVRTLNLPDEFIADAWGQKFTLAMTSTLAVNLGYVSDGGRVEVIDSTGTSVFSSASLAHYVVVSHGQTGAGGYQLGAGTAPPTPCTGAGTPEQENCNDDDTFRTTLLTSEASAANFYDDYLYYQGQTEPVLLIPQGAVMAFNLPSCPDGWAEYALAEGRFIIGADDGIAPAPDNTHQRQRIRVPTGAMGSPGGTQVPGTTQEYPIESYTAVNATNTATLNLTSGSAGNANADRALIPPYVALLYCEKQ